jgi:D-alanyl-D-alanine carboxypeptidase
MVEFTSATCRFLRRTTLLAFGIAIGVTPLIPGPAYARHRHHYAHVHRARVAVSSRAIRHPHFRQASLRPAHVRPGSFTPPFSVYAVDGNSGRVLYGRDENAFRHPASITKVMTLYLLFEQIEKGRLSLDTRIEVSAHAAAQPPTKLGLRPGSTIRVEDAIKAIVTKSSNDMAVAIAERIGGDEDTFARMMTRKAHALGMSRSNFVNASGLPDDRQLTTARDLVTLGRAIHDHYPRYFRFFATPSFRYAGQYMANHNHLMEQVEGMDGIKTGYTRASGFNLLSSVNRNGHWLVSVVLGGKTRLGRDRVMADLIESQIDKCATSRTAPMVAENPALEQVAEAVPVVTSERESAPPVETVDEDAAEDRPVVLHRGLMSEQGADAPYEQPALRLVPVIPQIPVTAANLGGSGMPMPRPRPAFISGVPKPPERDMTATGSIRRRDRDEMRLDGSTARYIGAATATPSTLKHRPQRDRADNVTEKAKPLRLASLESDAPAPSPRPSAHGGMLIQIGATPTIEQANALIARAKGAGRGALAAAHPFTEKVQKGETTLFRARFAGLDPNGADAVCKTLKRAGIACFAVRN